MHGHGTITYSDDGEIYSGQWLDGMRNGRGWCTKRDGSSFEGEWFQNEKHGPGKQTYPNGFAYVGRWCNGQPVNEAGSRATVKVRFKHSRCSTDAVDAVVAAAAAAPTTAAAAAAAFSPSPPPPPFSLSLGPCFRIEGSGYYQTVVGDDFNVRIRFAVNTDLVKAKLLYTETPSLDHSSKNETICATIKPGARVFFQTQYKWERDETRVSIRGPEVVQPEVGSEVRFHVDDSHCLNEMGRCFRVEHVGYYKVVKCALPPDNWVRATLMFSQISDAATSSSAQEKTIKKGARVFWKEDMPAAVPAHGDGVVGGGGGDEDCGIRAVTTLKFNQPRESFCVAVQVSDNRCFHVGQHIRLQSLFSPPRIKYEYGDYAVVDKMMHTLVWLRLLDSLPRVNVNTSVPAGAGITQKPS